MQFDHIRGEKLMIIAKAIVSPARYKVQLLLDEINKCEVVCANCHALRHGGTGTSYVESIS